MLCCQADDRHCKSSVAAAAADCFQMIEGGNDCKDERRSKSHRGYVQKALLNPAVGRRAEHGCFGMLQLSKSQPLDTGNVEGGCGKEQ